MQQNREVQHCSIHHQGIQKSKTKPVSTFLGHKGSRSQRKEMELVEEKDELFFPFSYNFYQIRELIYTALIWHHELKLKEQILYSCLRYIQKTYKNKCEYGNRELVFGCLYLSKKYCEKKKVKLDKWKSKLRVQISTQTLLQIQKYILQELDYSLQVYNRYYYMVNIMNNMGMGEDATYYCHYLLQISILVNVRSLTYSFKQVDIGKAIVMLACQKYGEDVQMGTQMDERMRVQCYGRQLGQYVDSVDSIAYLKPIYCKYRQNRYNGVAITK